MAQPTLRLITFSALLATVLCGLMVKACPLGSSSDCQQECQAYKEAKAATTPMYLNVNATLSEFTNTRREFNRKYGKDYEEDRMPEATGDACYFSNTNVGCSEFLAVGGACSWNYTCDYDKNRLPLYLWKASCNETISETIYYPVPVLKRSDSCNPQPTWQLVMEKVPVGCSCRNRSQ